MGVHFSFFLSSNKLLASYIHTLGGKTVLSSFVEKAKSFLFFFTVYHELTSVSCVGALLLIKSSSLNFQSLCTLATRFFVFLNLFLFFISLHYLLRINTQLNKAKTYEYYQRPHSFE